ncbi:MAG: phage terminase large subunit [Alphaproteobacteria bacterium]
MREVINGNKTFLQFVNIWNKSQSFKTPDIHKKIISYLEKNWKDGNEKSLLMAFRGAGKSTMVGLFCAWVLYRNPNIRIMVLSAESDLAKKMVRTVKRIIERHELTTHLKPKKAEQWAGNCFTVNREIELRDASMTAEGILGNITGSRADIIICDDVEVPNTSGTAIKRQHLRERLGEVDYILVPNGMQLYVGTPHNYYSIYSDEKIGDINPFLYGFNRLKIPVIDKDGKSSWAERFSIEDIKLLKIRHGEQKFMAQMQLQCVNPTESRLDAKKVKLYNGDMDISYANNQLVLTINKVKMVSVSTVWDPSYGSQTSDDSVIATVFTGVDGKYYLHDLEKINVDKYPSLDPARSQCKSVIDFVTKNFLPSVNIESNGLGKFLPDLLKSMLGEENIKLGVLPFNSKQAKNNRIMSAFDTVLDAGHLYMNKELVETGFLEQLNDFKPIEKNNKDDMIDAVAYCLNFEPVRIERKFGNKSLAKWNRGAEPTKAENDFTVF